MKLELYAIYNETQKKWWTQGQLTSEPCNPYLWYDKKKADRKRKEMDYFYEWSDSGETVKTVTLYAELA